MRVHLLFDCVSKLSCVNYLYPQDERRKLAQQEIDEKNRKERLEKRKEKREMFKKIREANQASTGKLYPDATMHGSERLLYIS